MFYSPRDGRPPLPHDPFKSIVVPRPIGWISTIAANGTLNLAPYSFFNGICSNPPMVMFSSDGSKHSVINAESSGEFVCSFSTWELREEMNISSAPLAADQSEFEAAGLDAAPSQFVKTPRVARAPAALECLHVETKELKDAKGNDTANYLVIGEVVGVYIDDAVLVDGIVNLEKIRPLSRLGYRDYTSIEKTFSMNRPAGGGDAPATKS